MYVLGVMLRVLGGSEAQAVLLDAISVGLGWVRTEVECHMYASLLILVVFIVLFVGYHIQVVFIVFYRGGMSQGRGEEDDSRILPKK